jgi:hypothetical protein
MKDDDDEHPEHPETWMSKFLEEALPYADLLAAAAPKDYSTWRVEERGPREFAVLRNGAPEDEPPDAVAFTRDVAYMMAASYTALGGAEPREGPPPGPIPTGPLAEADPQTAYLLTQMIAKPEVFELLLEATDHEVLRQAFEILHERLRKEGGGH